MAQWKVLLNHVKSTLTLVTSHKNELQEKLDNYTDEVISRAKSAMEDERKDPSVLREMNSMLETTLLFLKELDAQIDDATLQSTDPAQEFVQSADDISQETETSSQADKLKEHESRLNAIEDLINQTNTKLSSKIQEVDERTLKRMNKRLTNIDNVFTTRLDDMDQQLKQIGTIDTDMINQSIFRLDKVEKRMKKLEAGEKETSSRLAVLEDQLQDVHHIKQITEELRSKLGTLADNSDLIDVMKSSRQIRKTMEELSARMEVAEGFMKNSAANRIKDENKHREVEDRILVLESKRLKDLEHHTRKLEDVECKYQQVCKIVDDRVYPLRRLLDNLNVLHKRVESREDISKRLDEVAKQVTASSVSNLDTRTRQGPVGFTAVMPTYRTPEDIVLKDFIIVNCNEGGCYDPNTGIFEASRDGVYVASVYHHQEGNGEIGLAVHHAQFSSGENSIVCGSFTSVNKTCSSQDGVARLQKGDQFYIEPYHIVGNPQFIANFSCFSVGFI